MRTVKVHGAATPISRIAFGTGSLHHLPTLQSRVHLLSAVVDFGVKHIDASPYYGYGAAEVALANVSGVRSGHVSVATKVGLYPPQLATPWVLDIWVRKALGRWLPSISRPQHDWGVARARASLDRSLRRMRRDWVDMLLLHEPAVSQDESNALSDWLEIERRAGRIRAWGFAGAPSLVASAVSVNPVDRVIQTSATVLTDPLRAAEKVWEQTSLIYGVVRGLDPSASVEDVAFRISSIWSLHPDVAIIVSSRSVERMRRIGEAEAISP